MLDQKHRTYIAESAATKYESEAATELWADENELPFFVAYDIGMASVDAFFDDPGVKTKIRFTNTNGRREEIQAEIDLIKDGASRMVGDHEELDHWKRAIAEARMQAAELTRPRGN